MRKFTDQRERWQHTVHEYLAGTLSVESFWTVQEQQDLSLGALLVVLAEEKCSSDSFQRLMPPDVLQIYVLEQDGMFMEGVKYLLMRGDEAHWRALVDYVRQQDDDELKIFLVNEIFMALKSRKITHGDEYPEMVHLLTDEHGLLWFDDDPDQEDACFEIMDFLQHGAQETAKRLWAGVGARFGEHPDAIFYQTLKGHELQTWAFLWEHADEAQKQKLRNMVGHYIQEHPEDAEVPQWFFLVKDHLERHTERPSLVSRTRKI